MSDRWSDGMPSRGEFPALPAPQVRPGGLDLQSLRSLVDRLSGRQIRGLTVLGSGGELPHLTLAEREEVLRIVRSSVADCFRLIVGLARFETVQALEEANLTRRVVSA